MPKLRHGSLFSGIGGFDLAAEWMGWENVFHCEWNDFGKKILEYYWPNAISYDDITKTDFTIHRGSIDILTGGFPCQPYSMAGKRKGKDDERHLWPEMLRAIKEIQPRWIVGENVYGLVNWSGGLVFHEVQTDLEAEGYEVQPFLLPAAAVNAPHRRDRVWFVAYAKCNANGLRSERGMGMAGQLLERCQWEETANGFNNNGQDAYAPHPNGNGLNECNGQNEKLTSEGRVNALSDIEQMGGDAANADNTGLEGLFYKSRETKRTIRKKTKPICGFNNGGNAWNNFPSVSPVCHGDDGLSDRLDGITFSKWRTESIKGGGNAVVPQVVYQIFKTIDEYDRSTDPAAPDH